MPIYPNIYQTLLPGPIVELRGYLAACGLRGRLYAYLNYNGPTGTARDELAEGMLALALERGALTPGQTIVEAVSGPFATALTLAGLTAGHPVTLVMPEDAPAMRQESLLRLGAQIIHTPAQAGLAGARALAKATAAEKGWYYMDWLNNDDNPTYHRRVTGPALVRSIAREGSSIVDSIVIGVGSGGTITGVGETVKAWTNDVRIVAVEPYESQALSSGLTGSHGIPDIGFGLVPGNYNSYVVDNIAAVTTADAVRAAQRDAQLGGNGDLALVADLGLDPNIRRGVVQIKIPAVDIEALGLQIGVERQRQIDIGLEKHLHGAGDAADRGIEVVAVPEKGDAHAVGGDGLLLRKEIAAGDSIGLVGGLGNAERRIAGGGVVGRNGDEVRRIVPHIGGDVKAERRNAGLIVAGQRAVYIEVAGLAQPLKRKQYLVVFVPRRNGEDVAIEGCRAALAAAAVLNAVTEQILIIEGVGQRDGLPAGFPVVGLIKGVPLSVPVGVNGLCHGEGICPQKVPAVVEIKAFALQCRHSVFSLSDVLYTVADPQSYLYHTRCRGEKQVSFDGKKVLNARCSDKYQDMEIGPVCRQQGGVTQPRRQSGAVRARLCGKASAVREAAAGSKGNTAQFPPDGLSTAPAAAARHLRCQNAR